MALQSCHATAAWHMVACAVDLTPLISLSCHVTPCHSMLHPCKSQPRRTVGLSSQRHCIARRTALFNIAHWDGANTALSLKMPATELSRRSPSHAAALRFLIAEVNAASPF
jgi:hypothetical protein